MDGRCVYALMQHQKPGGGPSSLLVADPPAVREGDQRGAEAGNPEGQRDYGPLLALCAQEARRLLDEDPMRSREGPGQDARRHGGSRIPRGHHLPRGVRTRVQRPPQRGANQEPAPGGAKRPRHGERGGRRVRPASGGLRHPPRGQRGLQGCQDSQQQRQHHVLLRLLQHARQRNLQGRVRRPPRLQLQASHHRLQAGCAGILQRPDPRRAHHCVGGGRDGYVRGAHRKEHDAGPGGRSDAPVPGVGKRGVPHPVRDGCTQRGGVFVAAVEGA
mmetsp:Transcript_39411/g.92182  ORF Transcript_39411/g.92182 Transcript_39411/m.92182 type:complete len:273 (+) Transcript_39411:1274-2092(+)